MTNNKLQVELLRKELRKLEDGEKLEITLSDEYEKETLELELEEEEK